MADFTESSIKTYSGLSSEVKPTTATGYDLPNGSRWREVDTKKIYYYNLEDDVWYEYGDSLIGDSKSVVDIRALDLFEQMLVTLKKIEYHLSIATDTNLNDQDV